MQIAVLRIIVDMSYFSQSVLSPGNSVADCPVFLKTSFVCAYRDSSGRSARTITTIRQAQSRGHVMRRAGSGFATTETLKFLRSLKRSDTSHRQGIRSHDREGASGNRRRRRPGASSGFAIPPPCHIRWRRVKSGRLRSRHDARRTANVINHATRAVSSASPSGRPYVLTPAATRRSPARSSTCRLATKASRHLRHTFSVPLR